MVVKNEGDNSSQRQERGRKIRAVLKDMGYHLWGHRNRSLYLEPNTFPFRKRLFEIRGIYSPEGSSLIMKVRDKQEYKVALKVAAEIEKQLDISCIIA